MRCLDDQRKPDALRLPLHILPVGERILGAGNDRHPRRLGDFPRRCLVAKIPQHLRRRPHENDSRLRARGGKLRVLRQKPIPRMDVLRADFLRDRNDRRDIQIIFHRRVRPAHLVRLIRLEAMQRVPILPRINRHRAQPQLGGGASPEWQSPNDSQPTAFSSTFPANGVAQESQRIHQPANRRKRGHLFSDAARERARMQNRSVATTEPGRRGGRTEMAA